MVVNRPSVQAVIYDAEKGKTLLIEKHNTIRDVLVWRLVKGGVAEGETEPEALKREIKEEVGLKDVHIHEKIYCYEFVYIDKRHLVSVYLVEADMDEAIMLQVESEEESTILDHAWLLLDEALETLYWKTEKNSIRAAIRYLARAKKGERDGRYLH